MTSRFSVTKRYGHERGFSCAFRQWRATHSHCRLIHGYALAVTLEVGCDKLDDRNWVYDYGDFKEIKAKLEQLLDHTTIVAADDPQLGLFHEMRDEGLIDLRVLPAVGCERFAEHIAEFSDKIVREKTNGRAYLLSVKVSEHDGNSATYVACPLLPSLS